MLPDLHSAATYRTVIDGLAKKWANRGRLDKLEIGTLSLVELRSQTDALARRLAKTVGSGEYRLSTLVERRGVFGGKERVIYRPNLLDAIVLSVLARYLTELFEPLLCDTLHSFRPGHSAWKALAQLQQYLFEHRHAVTVRERGLYVLRRDVQKYGESVDFGDTSPRFEALRHILSIDSDPQRRALVETLVISAVRQPVQGLDGPPKPLECGLPTGSPIQPPLLNLYLSDVDRELSAVPQAFYCRFGDDILFLHSDAARTLAVSSMLDERLTTLRLASNAEKRRDLYFNGAGRPAPLPVPFVATQRLEYLGASVSFEGNLGLKTVHFSRLFSLLRERLNHIARESSDFEQKTRLDLLCEATARALDPRDPLALPGTDRVHACLDDRSQMADFDYRVALTIAELFTHTRGVRAFRALSRATLRKHGVYSLVDARRRSARSSGMAR